MWENGVTTNLIGRSFGSVRIGDGLAGVQNILAAINISNPSAYTAIAPDDRSDTAARNMIIGTSPTDSGEGYISGLAPANINYRYIDTSSLTIDTDEVRRKHRQCSSKTASRLIYTAMRLPAFASRRIGGRAEHFGCD